MLPAFLCILSIDQSDISALLHIIQLPIKKRMARKEDVFRAMLMGWIL